MTFEESVKHQKAAEWLLMNDPVVRAVFEYTRTATSDRAVHTLGLCQRVNAKLVEVAERMVVTEQERQEGYPLPADEMERIRRAEIRSQIKRKSALTVQTTDDK